MQYFIYLVAFLEGFTTLSIEIIALRKFTPIIGSNSISTSIILGIILLALSYGYYIGGKQSQQKEQIPKKVIRNVLGASCYYLLFTFIFDTTLLQFLLHRTENYFLSLLLASFFLFFIPVFLASQTIPLISELYKGKSGEKIGQLLFFSTIGSFLGSITTSSLLFGSIGVTKSAFLNIAILALIGVSFSFIYLRNKPIYLIANTSIFLYSLCYIYFSFPFMTNAIYYKDNAHHNIYIYETKQSRIFSMNGAYSSGIDKDTGKSSFEYIKEIKQQALSEQPKNIAVIGAAGFTLPQELAEEGNIERIDVVDIDTHLANISEKYFLQKPLHSAIHSITQPARFFLQNSEKYDIIIVDVYVGTTIPPQTVTKEFFEILKQKSKTVYINMILQGNTQDTFSKKFIATMQHVYGDVFFKKISTGSIGNFVITNRNIENYEQFINQAHNSIYTDDKNSMEMDLFNRLQHIGI